MKLKFLILLVIIVTFCSCESKSMNKESYNYIGIDHQILNIVDSLLLDSSERSFITIWFTMYNDSNHVVKFLNTVIIPPPSLPPKPIKEALISESNGFVGYKKYDSICLIFLDTYSDGYFNKFVKKDSLKFDEEPFKDLYNLCEKSRLNLDKTIEKTYLINKDDSLILVRDVSD